MALTYTIDAGATGPRRYNGRLYWDGTITLDASYATNGWALDKAKFGFPQEITFLGLQSFHSKFWFDFDKTNQKLRSYERQLKTGATAAANMGNKTGAALLTQANGNESAGFLAGSAVNSSYDLVYAVQTAANETACNGVVLRVHAEGR
jgi:hypothetical protein